MLNWLNFIQLILQLAEADVPAVARLIGSIQTASPAHQAAVNTAVCAALAALAAPAVPPFPGSAVVK